jgi:hypothetical protein
MEVSTISVMWIFYLMWVLCLMWIKPMSDFAVTKVSHRLLSSYCNHVKAPMYSQYIGIFFLHRGSWHHWFPEVRRPWHHGKITVNGASNNQSATNTIASILLSHRKIQHSLYTRYYLFQILDLKIRCSFYMHKYSAYSITLINLNDLQKHHQSLIINNHHHYADCHHDL